MNRPTLFVLLASVVVLQVGCPRPAPTIDRFFVEPTSACPGGVIRLNAAILNGQGFTYRFLFREFAAGGRSAVLQAGDLSGSPENKRHETRLCEQSTFCIQILDADETVIDEDCDAVLVDSREREDDRLIFGPNCPDDPTSFRPVDITEDDPGGSQVVAALRNSSRYNVILTHVGLDGIPVEERADAGQIFTELVGRELYGSWSIEVEDARFNPDLQICREEGREIVPPFMQAEAIAMELRVRCGDDSPACPVVRP